jgi:hypothetical protein
VNKVLKVITSLRLTVVCLCFAILLVFIGTLAQVDEGTYIAQTRYFRSLLIFWSPNPHVKIPVFPGGYLVGGLLLINLIAAHFAKFKFSKKKIGILLTHFGLILLLIGQFVTDIFSHESQMRLQVGETKNFSEAFRETELAIIDTSSDPQNDRVYAISDSLIKKQNSIESSKLPFSVRVKNYYPNAMAYRGNEEMVPPMAAKTEANAGEMKSALLLPMPVTNNPEERNVPAALVELIDKGKSLGTFFVWAGMAPQTFSADGKQYEVGLRFERDYYPFTITLLDATHEKYKGTEVPKNFASRVRIENPQTHEARETQIYMNNPLRYAGLTFFQYQMSPEEFNGRPDAAPESTFQVVRNPGWVTPYLGCLLVAAGLVIQFMTHLIGFATKRRTPQQSATTQQASRKSAQPKEEVSR